MLGVGENHDQILRTLHGQSIFISPPSSYWLQSLVVIELRKVGVDVVTFGQYMRPTKRHMKVARYVEPPEFLEWKRVAEGLGFCYVASGPLVRSSYKVSV
jgi:lipoic acid synthetase